jgi:hypothetical protein
VKLSTRLLLAATAALSLSVSAIAQVPQATPFSADAQIKYELGESPQQWHGKLHVGSEHMRFEIETANPSDQRPILLTNFATQTDDVLLPAMKAYIEHPIGDPHSRGPALVMRDLRAYDPGNPCANQTKISCKKIGVESIGGRSCDHWELDGQGRTLNVWLDQKLHFPLKTVTEDATVTLSNIKEGAPASTLFQIPADYKKANMHPSPGTMPSQPQPKQ